MRLYLIRHGEAIDSTVDPERPLSAQGRKQARTLGAFLKTHSPRTPAVWHSTKTRAKQTAEAVAQEAGWRGLIEEHAGLAPGDSANTIAGELGTVKDDLCIVTHLPFVANLASQLLNGSDTSGGATWSFGPASILCIEHDPSNIWHILWFVNPQILTRSST